MVPLIGYHFNVPVNIDGNIVFQNIFEAIIEHGSVVEMDTKANMK